MCLVNYSYLADGTKLSALDDDGGGLLYRGSLIYRKTEGEIALESILFEGGRFVPNGGPMLHVTDHLGSVRAVVNAQSGEVTETSDYFPFGMRMDIWGAVEDESNRYRFNGKEDQEGEFGVPTLDYGARHYSASSARWLSMDPLAEKYYSISPYAFCNNNPVIYVDPDGKAVETLWDIASIGMGVRSFVKNIKSGNVRGAVGDAVGVVVDAVAAAVPFVPGGVGAVRAGAKAVNAAGGAIDAVKAVDAAKDAGKAVKNPFGAKGKLDHQNKVDELANQAEKELRAGEEVLRERGIRVEGSNRRPDVQILDKDGKTRKVFEAERHPNSKRNRLREEEYNRLGIEYETHSLD